MYHTVGGPEGRVNGVGQEATVGEDAGNGVLGEPEMRAWKELTCQPKHNRKQSSGGD